MNALLRDGGCQASKITIESTQLIIPVVELPSDYNSKFRDKLLQKSFQLTLSWDKLQVYEIANFTNGQIDYEIASAVYGIDRLYVLAIPQADWNNQTNVETFTNTSLSNVNVIIDGDQYYAQNINDDELAYELLKEMF